MSIKMMKRAFIATFLVFLWGCEELNFTGYTIEYPENNGTYVGTVNQSPPAGGSGTTPLEAEFRVAYATPPSSQPDIVLNGHRISQFFIFGPEAAVADIEQIKQFFRHGKNTLSVAPTAFGPSMVFNLDMHGPTIVITRGEVSSNGSSVEIEGFLRDFSETDSVMKLDLVRVTGYHADGRLIRSLASTKLININEDGTFCACGASAVQLGTLLSEDALLYSFTAKDIYGYERVKEYLADNDGTGDVLPLENAVRVAIGDSFIESMRPIIASAIYQSLQEAPIDIRDQCWTDPNKDDPTPSPNPNTNSLCANGQNGSTFPRGLNPINVNIGLGDMPTTVKRMFMNDDPNKTSTMLLNRFKLQENNEINLDLVITEMEVALTIDGGWFLGDINMTLYIERTQVDAIALASAVNKKMFVQLDANRSNMQLSGVSSSNATIWGIPINGLVNLIMPALEGALGGMLPGIINPILEENLQKLTLGGAVTQPENQTSFDMLLNIAELGTDNLLGPSMPFDMKVSLESVVDVSVSDENVNKMLGPVFYDDPVDPNIMFNSLGETGTNLTVAINSNLINQSLAAMHATGVTFFTMHNGKVYHGAHKNTPAANPLDLNSATIAQKGDTRTRLWPDMPPTIIFSEVIGQPGQGRAAIEFESATLYQDKLVEQGGQLVWQNDIALRVNFDLAVNIDELDGVFTMRAAGPPLFKINNMINNTPWQIPPIIIQGILDTAMLFGGDLLADRFIVLDLGTIADDTINGQQVLYMSDKDDYTITGSACLSFDDNGDPVSPLPAGVTAGSDGKYDLICEEINFVVTTNAAGVTGAKGSNLFFQMEARDPAIPPAPAIPRFDLDDDGIVDYRDNCALPTGFLVDAITLAGGVVGNIDENGDPIGTFEDDVKYHANRILAERYTQNPAAAPSATDIAWYNVMRAGDAPISGGSLGSYPWLRMLYANTSQTNIDGDRVGDLCENDDDRDGIWASYDDESRPNDNCPYIYNPGQEDTQNPPGVGDACNVRTTFVLLRSLESSIEGGGTPRCLTRKGLTGTGWVSNTLHNMEPCNPLDTDQHWYMKALNPNDLNAGVEFYNNSTRNSDSDFRLVSYGVAYSQGKAAANPENQTRVNEMRLLRTNNSGLNGQNDDSVSACGWGAFACRNEQERADPVFFLRGAAPTNNFIESLHPWYIDTSFGTGKNGVPYPYPFANGNWNNIGKNSCMTYSNGWGVDIGSTGDGEFCATGARWRWAIWVAGTNSPWNGEW